MVSTVCIFGQPSAGPPAFEVASVRPNRVGNAEGEGKVRESVDSTPASLTMRNVSLNSCLKWAYGVKDYQISGPRWLTSEKYDVVAKTGRPATNDQLRLMLQTLLAERFQTTLHRETKELPMYALVVGKNGPKLQETKGGPSSKDIRGITIDNGGVVYKNTSMAELADALSATIFGLNRPVLDKTGLEGSFDFTVKLAESTAELKGSLRSIADDPSIMMSALQQIGLKLEPQKGPVEILVIDHAEKVPTEN
ncbi:MAG TPA: TIGR03435 family protein [Candidatus Acidoferrales bacterium]|nr:TIGR03435 family protein [Candidatus Acidoferrales bacterium]